MYVSFNSLFEMRLAKELLETVLEDFQFSIRDAPRRVDVPPEVHPEDFQFSIRDATPLPGAIPMQRLRHFQFSIRDAPAPVSRPSRMPSRAFQFSIRDAVTLRTPQRGQEVQPFNSLFEMHVALCREPPISVDRLSILYSRCWGFLSLVFVGF